MAEISQSVNIEMLEKLPDGTYKRKYPKTKASQVKLEDTSGNFVATEVEGAMSELFTNVSNGKDLVGGAITDVDDSVVIPADPSFSDLASAIGGISTGKKWASGLCSPTSATLQFTNTIGTNSSKPYIKISGLEFKPSVVIISASGLLEVAVDTVSSKYTAIDGYTVFVRRSNDFFKLSVNAYLEYGGFQLPVHANYANQEWIAFE